MYVSERQSVLKQDLVYAAGENWKPELERAETFDHTC